MKKYAKYQAFSSIAEKNTDSSDKKSTNTNEQKSICAYVSRIKSLTLFVIYKEKSSDSSR